MAIDQTILESTMATGQTTLRFYRWNTPTLSLGYFQKAADRSLHPASEDCPMIRRASGGGAIVHHDELTYSICVATEGRIAKANTGLYDIVHDAIRKSLAEQGIEVELFESDGDSRAKASASDPFLCFERRAAGDIICEGAKVGGSAQRRLKNSLIQHGSLLLSQSSFAPELPGLKELGGIKVDEVKLTDGIQSLLTEALHIGLSAGNLTNEERLRADEIEAEKFANAEWLNKR